MSCKPKDPLTYGGYATKKEGRAVINGALYGLILGDIVLPSITVDVAIGTMILVNQPFATYLANNFCDAHINTDHLRDDLCSAAALALSEAVKSFPRTKPKFPAAYIRQSIIHAIGKEVHILLNDDTVRLTRANEGYIWTDFRVHQGEGQDESLPEALKYGKNDQDRALILGIVNGKSIEKIAREQNTHPETIRRRLKKIGEHIKAGTRSKSDWSGPMYALTEANKRIALDLWPQRVKFRVHQAISVKDGVYIHIDDGEAETITRNETEREVADRLRKLETADPSQKRPRHDRDRLYTYIDPQALGEYLWKEPEERRQKLHSLRRAKVARIEERREARATAKAEAAAIKETKRANREAKRIAKLTAIALRRAKRAK